MYTVYKHTAPGGKVYIGITALEPAKRWRNEGRGYNRNKHFYSAIKLYGWENIQHEIIAEGLTKAQAAALEIELIAKYDSTNPAKGYNQSTGGEVSSTGVKPSAETRRKQSEAKKGANHVNYGTQLSEETRQRISKALKGRKGKRPSQETRQKLSACRSGEKNPNFGKHFTEETRRKISEAKKGRHLSAETRQKMSEYHQANPPKNSRAVLCVETGFIFSSACEAARETGADYRKISAVCRGERKTTGGLHFQYIKE